MSPSAPPTFFAYDCQTLDVSEMLEIEFDVFPQRACFPAMRIVHFKKQPYLSFLSDQSFHFRNEMFVILFVQFVACADNQKFVAICFLLSELYCHTNLLSELEASELMVQGVIRLRRIEHCSW